VGIGRESGQGPRDPLVRLTLTTTTPRHVREELTGPPIRTEWVSEDRNYEFPISVLDNALTELQRIRDQVHATQSPAKAGDPHHQKNGQQ